MALVSTTYKVTVEVPEGLLSVPVRAASPQKTRSGFIAAKAVGPDTLTASNFAVVCVDLAGVILEIIPLAENSVSPNEDGSWNITASLAPSVNCLIVASLYQPISIDEGEPINEVGHIYAPNTAETIIVSPASTVAFNTFVEELGGSGTFEEANIDPQDPVQITAVDNVMTNIAALLAEQNFSETTLAELLTAIELILAPVIEQEVVHIQNPVASSAVELIRDDGGMHYFSGGVGGTRYTALVGNTATYKEYVGGVFVPRETNGTGEDYVLSSNGWAEKSRVDVLGSYNGDGSVTFVDSNADGEKTFYHLTQGFSLEGSNIRNVLLANQNTASLATAVSANAMFGAGAKGYRVQISYPQTYSIYINTGDANGFCWSIANMLPSDANGNCNQQEMRRDANIFERPVVAYSSLFSADVHINSPGSRALTLGAVGVYRLDVQLINDSARTVKYYSRSWDGTDHAQLIATGTWTEFSLPNVNGHNLAVRFDYPPSVLASSNIWGGKTYEIFTVQNGFVRGFTDNPARVQAHNVLVFNTVAFDSVMNALP